jgi:hypothetical protein
MGWAVYLVVGAVLLFVNKRLAFGWMILFGIYILVNKGNVGW